MGDYADEFDESNLPEGACAVYVMSPHHDGPIKIGISTKPKARLSQLQTAHPNGMTIDAVCWVNSRHVAESLEKWFLKLFAKRALNGEWLEMGPFEIAELLGPIIKLVAPEYFVPNGSYSAWVSPPTEAQKRLYNEPWPTFLTARNISTMPSLTPKN